MADFPPSGGITLSDAIKQNRLPEFIKQAEERLKELGATHPEAKAVESSLSKAIKTAQSKGRT